METVTLDELKTVFSENVKARRNELGLSQSELARQTRIDQANISGFESGSRLPSLESLTRLAAGLNIAPDVLLRAKVFSKSA